MKRAPLPMLIACLAASGLYSQNANTLLETYQRNFIRSSFGTKLVILQEASSSTDVSMGPLYDMAVQFVLNYASLLQSDAQLQEIAVYSVKMIQKYKYVPSARNIWSLLQIYRDEEAVQAAVLLALGDIASGNTQMIENLNSYLANQHAKYKGGETPDYASLEACIVALGKLGSGTSFSVLFSSYVTGYNDTIRKKAQDALSQIKGDSKTLLIEVIRKNPPVDKYAALKFGLENANFSSTAKAEIAEAALDIALGYSGAGTEDQATIREMRYQSVREIAVRKWSKASGLVVSNFYQAQTEYNRGTGGKAPLLEGIGCLGVMGTTDAALALALYLQLINSETEAGRSYDEQITLAVINNLGVIGDKVAFDFLLYVGYLKYSDTVKKTAKDMLKKIKL